MLETPLVVGDALFIKFPFLVGSATAKISTSMDIGVAGTMSTTPQTLNAVGVSSSVDQRFYVLASALSANTWYRVQVNITDASAQTVGVAGCVWFATTSTYLNNYITYDENRCFDVLSFAPQIDTTNLKVDGYYLYSAASTYKTIGGSYTVNFDITPNVAVASPGAIVTLTISGYFTFSGTCTSIACTSNDGTAGDYCPTTNLTALPSSAYTCTILSNVLTLRINQAVTTNTTRIQVGVTAPNRYVSSAESITASYGSIKAAITFSTIAVTAGSMNGINLVTDFTALSVAGVNKLMWGVTPTASTYLTNRASGYAGCPIVLYASGANVKIFNTLLTSFTLSATVRAMTDHSNMKATWTIIASGSLTGLIEALITNSISTSLPGTLTFTPTVTSSTVLITGITDLSTSSYTLGVKFSLDILSNSNANEAILSSLTSGGSSSTVGGLVIQLGDSSGKTMVTVTGQTIGVLKNMEYHDNSLYISGSATNIKQYNLIYSYWYSDSNFDFSTAAFSTATFLNNFLLGGASNGATAAVWPKPASASGTQGLLIPIVFAITAVCVAGSTDYDLDLSSLCDPTADYALASLLKVVFNNNVLKIPDASFSFGAKVIVDLFAGGVKATTIDYSTTNQLVIDYDNTRTSTANPLGNIIAKDTTNNFWHLSIACLPTAIGDACYKSLVYDPTSSPETFGALAFVDTRIANYPTPYADSYVLDFIICLKVTATANYVPATPAPLESSTTTNSRWQLVQEGCETAGACTVTAGPGMINGYVISGMVDSTTIKTSLVNGYLSSAAGAAKSGYGVATVKEFIPAYLRVGFTITSPVASGTNIGVFMNGAAYDASMTFYGGLSTYADATTKSVNIIDIVGSVTTATVFEGSSTYYADSVDKWWSDSGFIIPAAISTASTTVHYYIPIQVTMSNILSMNIAIMGAKSNNAYTVNAVYRVFGSVVSNPTLGATPTYSTQGAAFIHTFGTIADAEFTIGVISTSGSGAFTVTATAGTNVGLWDSDLVGGNTQGCHSGLGTTTAVPKLNPGNSAFILPSKVLTAAYILSDLSLPAGTSCNVGAGNTGAYAATVDLVSNNAWGVAFIVYVRESTNIFSASTLTWGYANSGTNKCVLHTVVYSTANIYTIFCTADAATGLTSFGTGSKTIALSSFTVPFYWGSNYAILSKLNYAWSGNTGTIAAFNGDTSTTSTWTYSDCVASDITNLPIDSYDAPYTMTLTSANGISYIFADTEYLSLAVTTSQTNTFYSSCSNSQLTCSASASSSPTFTLTSSGAKTMSGASIVITGWIDTGAASSIQTYSVAITFNGGSNIIETCSSSAAGGIQVTVTTPLLQVVTIGSISYVNNLGARGQFSFTFSYNRIIRIGYDFLLNLGALSAPTKDSENYRCVIYQGSSVSNSWSTVSPIDITAYTTTVISKVLFASGGTFTYKCFGGNTPDGTVAFSNLMQGWVERSSGGTKVTLNTVPTANQYTVATPNTAASTMTVSMSKFFNTRGFDSDYSFSFIPSAANYTLAARIIVEFSQSIPPKLNRFGLPECYFNETPALCQFTNERRISVSPTINMMSTATYPYVVKIAGVTQPNSFATDDADTNKKIYFAIDSDDNENAGVVESTLVTEVWDPASSSSTIASILIHDFTYSQNNFRSTSSFTYVLNVPSNQFINEDSILFVQFPKSLAPSLFYGSVPSFTMYRVGDSTTTNLVKRSSILRGRRVAVFLKADSLNTVSLNYTFSIGTLATPFQPSPNGNGRGDFRIFTSADNITVVASTAPGARNSSTYMSWTVGSYSNAKILNWFDSSMNRLTMGVDVTLGTYRTVVCLAPNTGKFTNTFTFTVNGGNSSSFLTQPADPNYPIRAALGTNSTRVHIAAKTGTPQGRYYLKWSSADTSGYSSIPNLDLHVIGTNCTPSLSGNSFEVPYGGGISDPIVVDFSQCIPATDVTVSVNVSSGFNLSSSTGISLSSQQIQSDSLTFTTIDANYKVIFYANSNQGSNGTNLQNAAILTFTFSGTNGANIANPGTVSINLVQASTIPPVPYDPQMSSSVLKVGCDQKGTNFFAVGVDTSAAAYNLTYIDSVTQNVKVSLTKVDDENDPNFLSFGYLSGLVPPSLSSMSLVGNLKAGANLTVYSYCLSNSMVESTNASSLSWVQPDNGGSAAVLTAKFKAPLTSSQKVQMACALAQKLVVSSKFITTDEGDKCTTLRLLQTNNTNTTTNNTNNVVTNNTNNTANYSSSWFVLKNYLAALDNTATTLSTQAASLTFLQDLVTTIADSTFPTLASNVSVVSTLILSSSNASVVPVVNMVGSPVVDYQSISVNLNLTNINGIIYAGVGEINVSTPNVSQLIKGNDGSNVNLKFNQYAFASAGNLTSFVFSPLTNSTNYTIFYAASNLDVSVGGMRSSVYVTYAQTSQPPNTFGCSISVSMMLLGILILGLLGMI